VLPRSLNTHRVSAFGSVLVAGGAPLSGWFKWWAHEKRVTNWDGGPLRPKRGFNVLGSVRRAVTQGWHSKGEYGDALLTLHVGQYSGGFGVPGFRSLLRSPVLSLPRQGLQIWFGLDGRK